MSVDFCSRRSKIFYSGLHRKRMYICTVCRAMFHFWGSEWFSKPESEEENDEIKNVVDWWKSFLSLKGMADRSLPKFDMCECEYCHKMCRALMGILGVERLSTVSKICFRIASPTSHRLVRNVPKTMV